MPNLFQATGNVIDAIRINRIRRITREGRAFWVKRRRWWSRALVPCANAFFLVAGNPVIVWADSRQWQRWEVESFRLLHGPEGFHAFAEEGRAVWAEQLPGVILEEPARRGRLSGAMLAAAARELKRAHRLPCRALGGRWSHGDPHLGNFVFDKAARRARLIDFELAHRAGMREADRHADDLLVVFQSMMGYPGYANFAGWIGAVTHFLRAYRDGSPGEEEVFARLLDRLRPPTGISRLWWSIRTDYIPAPERNRRIAALREVLREGLRGLAEEERVVADL